MTNKKAAITIIKELRSKGFEALLAGGCVRDMLLGRTAKDYDVATDANPKQIMKLFRRTLKIGAKFGVVIILIEEQQVEVATFRSDADYADGRHPSKVQFVSAAEDASRRDFTINGMFYDPLTEKIIDHVDGQGDLKSGLLRTIGPPEKRFSEDYLRMLRAVRFATQLNFKIEPQTWQAICANANKITKISGERQQMELEGLLVDPNRSTGAGLLFQSRLAETIFPGLTGQKATTAVNVLEYLRKRTDFALALASLFVGCATEFALEKVEVLKLSRSRNRHVKFLLENRSKLLDDRMPLAQLKKILAKPYFWDLYELQKAMQKARVDNDKGLGPLIRIHKRIKALGDVELQPKPFLNGRDLIKLGAVQGPALGQLAEELYIAQLEGTLKNAEAAKRWTIKWLKNHKIAEE